MSPRTLEANQQIRDARRDQILRAALKIFARQGYSAAKISEIAALAGVSYGLVDHYFGNKEDVFIAVVKDAFEGALTLFERVSDMPGSPWERLSYLCATLLDGIRETPEYVLLISQVDSVSSIPDETRQLFYTYEKRSLALQENLVLQGQVAGEVASGDPLALVMAFSGMIQGLAVHCADPVRWKELQEHFPTVDTVTRLFKPI